MAQRNLKPPLCIRERFFFGKIMIHPSLEEYKRKTSQGERVPVYTELSADLDTPVSVFLKMKGTSPAFLLESVERGVQVGRYSFIGANPSQIFTATSDSASIRRGKEIQKLTLNDKRDAYPTKGTARRAPADPLHVLKNLLYSQPVVALPELPLFYGGAVGYLSYDMVRFFEKLPPFRRDELGLPECSFMITDSLVIFDHVQNSMKIVALSQPTSNPSLGYKEAVEKISSIHSSLQAPIAQEAYIEPYPDKARVPCSSNFTQSEFEKKVLAAKEYVLSGDAFQVVLSQRLQRTTTASPFSVYRALRRLNPSPYMFYLDFLDFQLIGSSPEMLVRLQGKTAETRPIAGTRPRGKNEEEDKALVEELLADPKERAEHIMLVDLGRNDLGRVCEPGSVRVTLNMGIEKYSHVIHIVSSVEGKLLQEQDSFDFIRASFPAGTVTGAPKIRAMEIINELEGLKRGPYAGAVGYFGFGGNMDTCITIRTIVMKGNRVYFQGGAGIVADSQPEKEYQESLNKIEVLRKAVDMAEGIAKRRVYKTYD